MSQRSRVVWRDGEVERGEDLVACEGPLEIRVAGQSVAVLMRTPGHDEDLVWGFLVSEGIIESPQQVAALGPCSESPYEDVVQVTPRAEHPIDLRRLRRHFFASSSCGVCGKASLDQLLVALSRPLRVWSPAPAALWRVAQGLQAHQQTFLETGGVHAAALFDPAGEVVVVREDVGRHNAVDKVLGHATRGGLDVTRCGLFVSGRVSFEIVQKARVAAVPVVAGISAVSSMAVDLAREHAMVLCGFVRQPRLVVYAGELAASAPPC